MRETTTTETTMELQEAVDRLIAMSDDEGATWDLSPNDKRAIRAVLRALANHQSQNGELWTLVDRLSAIYLNRRAG